MTASMNGTHFLMTYGIGQLIPEDPSSFISIFWCPLTHQTYEYHLLVYETTNPISMVFFFALFLSAVREAFISAKSAYDFRKVTLLRWVANFIIGTCIALVGMMTRQLHDVA